jgi:ubiquinol-cytochrome c reductase cytochrome c1 subunit
MIRLIAILVGLGFAAVAVWSFGWGAAAVIGQGSFVEPTAEHEFHLHPKEVAFPNDGPFGKWDLAELQRGYQVYKEVCASCHSMSLVAMRDLAQLGYNEAEVKAEAASWTVPSLDQKTGETTTRPGAPTDYFPSPYANDIARAAAGNPPDLSLITKARHDGPAYVYSLLTGYQSQPAKLLEEFPDSKTPAGLYFNPYFANLNIRMPPPLTSDGQVTYADGTKSTIAQNAKDVAAFLTWAAEPTLVKRKQTGWAVLVFLIFATVLAWLAKKAIWAPIVPQRRKKIDL